MIRSTQKRHLLALLTVVLALFALLLMHPTAGAADDSSDTLVGANIKDGVLLGYYGLGGDIVLPSTVTKIGDDALKGNDNIVSITIPGSVKDIGNNAFKGCTKLEQVIFTNPEKTSNNLIIRLSAFQNCKKLTECEIPARAYQVVGNIFKGCTSLTEVKVNAANPYYFTRDGVLFGPALVGYKPQYDGAYALQSYPAGRQGAYTIPSEVNGKEIDQIWTSGFEGAASLTDITIPASIGRLGTAAFENTGLTHVTIPDTVQQVDPAVFQNCTELVSVKLPAGLAEIDQYMFANCTSLQYVDMPDSITKINIYAFHNCTSLTSLALPKGLTSLSVGCFEKCYNLQHVVVPPSVINFPKDDVGVYNPFKYSPVTVYVQKGSTGDRFFNNNLAELQASATASGGSLAVVTLNSVADPASIDVSSLELIDAGRQISVAGKFRIGSYLDVQPLTSGSAYNTFSAKANGKAFRAYSLALMPSGASASGPFSLTVGQPDGFSSSATLYDANGALPTDYADSSFTASLSALGPVAIIDIKEETGDTEITSVTLNSSTLTLEAGKTGKLSATVWPASATDKSITWSSSKTDVASVSSNGTVTAKKAGTAVITATATNGKSASCTVTVTGGTVSPAPGGTTTPGDTTKNPFTDVAQGAYYYDAVQWAVGKKITSGTSATTFTPDGICTRAQTVTFLWRSQGSPKAAGAENPFTDVSKDAYYYDAVLWAVEQGITNGTSAITFSPDATVTRGQTAAFLWRVAKQPQVDQTANPFADVTQNAYYYNAVLWAVAKEITNGTSSTTFSPDQGCTRAQIVTFLWRTNSN